MSPKKEDIPEEETETPKTKQSTPGSAHKTQTPEETVVMVRGSLLERTRDLGSKMLNETVPFTQQDRAELVEISRWIALFFPEYFGDNAPKKYSEEEMQVIGQSAFEQGIEEGKKQAQQEFYQKSFQTPTPGEQQRPY